jgi:hypothetical protein
MPNIHPNITEIEMAKTVIANVMAILGAFL